MSSSNSPCAACKCLRRKCTQECVFAPYFPPDNPQKFTNVHKVFGASNVSKLLNELNVSQREEAVNSLAYEADYRLKDPVYGCVGLISILQHKLKQVHLEIENAKKELATYIGPSAMLPVINHPGYVQQQHANYPPSAYQMMPYNVQPMMGLPTGIPHGAQLVIREPQQQQQQQQQHQFLDAQQLAAAAAAAAREQEMHMLRSYEQQQQQQQQNELMRFNGGFEDAGGPVTATGFNQIGGGGMQQQPSLALGSTYEAIPYHHIQQQQQQQHQEHPHLSSHHLHLQQDLLMQHQQQQNLAPRTKKDEEERSIGPSCQIRSE